MPATVAEVKDLSWDELNYVFALSHASEIRAVVERGSEALKEQVATREPQVPAALAAALTDID